jgi:hypothetical protein
LDETDNFTRFSKEELDEIFGCGQFLQCEKGHILKDMQNYLCIVFSGAIQVYDELIPKLYIVQPGEFFAQPSISLSVAARENTKLFLISTEELLSLKKRNFDAWLKLQHTHFKTIVQLLLLLERRILCFEAQCYTDAQEEPCAE